MSKTPAKPALTNATVEVLLAHYNSQVADYNKVIALRPPRSMVHLDPMLVLTVEQLGNDEIPGLGRLELVNLICRQNRKLGKTIRRRALALLEERIKGPDGLPMKNEDGRTVGLKYKEVLHIIKTEFPEASTSVACLRWYIVHLKIDANDQGLPWPDLPQLRPRSIAKGERV